nr:gliding motility-associated C-terminal domain-containing protein [Bacteroidales bacterium]
TYDITVGTCSASDNITIHVDAMPDATITPAGPYCVSDAAVILTAADAGGTWSGTGISNATTGEFDPSVAGAGSHVITYDITNGVCTDTDNITIDVDDMPDPSITPQTDLCENEAAVTLVAVDAGGTWSGTGVSGNSFDPSIAGAGDFVVTYDITNGTCSDSDNITIHVDAMPDASITPAGPYCISDAAVILTAADAGGTWSGNGITGNSFSPSSAGAGDHVVTYDIMSGTCSDSDNIVIHVDAMPDASITPQADFCVNDANVILTAVNSGGSWSGTGIVNSTLGEFSPSTAGSGSHTISYEISNGECTDISAITIQVYDLPDISIDIVQNPLCHNESTGMIQVSSPGSISASYDWGSLGTGSVVTNLSANTYTVVVTDNGCANSETITLTNPDELTASIIDVEHVTCHSYTDGQAVVVASGGVGTYDYLWSNNVTLPVNTNVVADDYQVIVTDDNECEVVASVSITEPEPLVLTENITPIICGHAPGSCGVSVSGGNGGYIYDWQGHSGTGPNISGLSQGMYTVDVADAEGCNAQTSMFVPVNGSLNVIMSEDQPITCFGESNAILSVTAPGGMNPLAYQWNIGLTSHRIENLSSGIYSVIVTDSLGCTGSESHQVTEPLPINLDFATENVRCHGEDNGQAIVMASGGTGPYSMYWPNHGVGDTLNQLSAGYYTVVVSDVHSCEAIDSVFIIEPESAVGIDLLSRNISCYGMNNGQIAASGVGGTSPYSYEWSFGEDTSEMPEISNLQEGFYSLVVSDNRGCIVDTLVVISEPAPIMLDYSTVNPSCIGNNDGSIDMAVVGGVEPYTFMWDNATGNLQFIDGLYEGNYFITIQDANDCVYEMETITLMDTPEECLRIPNAFTPNGDVNNDTWIIENIEMFPNAIVQVFNRWGQVVFEGKHGVEPWDGKDLRGNLVPTASYIYIIHLYNGMKPKTGTVTVVY